LLRQCPAGDDDGDDDGEGDGDGNGLSSIADDDFIIDTSASWAMSGASPG
jgi:hypothetical protein